jgi:hypothetical protein
MAFANRFLALVLAASAAFAQVPAAGSAPEFSQQELDQMLAPIALYPDPLLSQILMAATYPLEIVEASRWVGANPGLRGEEAVRAAAAQPWDPSVKSLVAFPRILALMDQRIDWTQRLGNAFLAQQAQVMDTVQELRRRAQNAGNLRSSDEVRVEDRGGSIALEPVNPRIAYVPYYDPLAIYGTWWWPGFPPVFWPPWPGYYVRPGISAGLIWGVGVAITAGFFFGAFDWPHRHVSVVHLHSHYYRPGRVNVSPGPWQHDADHRRGVPYRGESVRQKYHRLPPPPPAGGSRTEFRGRQPQAVQPPPPGAFEGIRAGARQTREFSTRGQASMRPHSAPAPRAAPPSRPAPARTPPAAAGGKRK